MFSLKSGYFVGCLLLGLVYVIMYFLRRDLRKEMRVGGFLLAPFAVIAPFYIPEYWNPPYLFGLLYPFSFGIEDIMFCFFVGGISAVVYEIVTNKKEIKIKKSKKINWTPYAIGVVILLVGEFIFPQFSMLISVFMGIVVACFMVFSRHDLLIQAVSAGVMFTVFYFVFFKVFMVFYPRYIPLIYKHENLLGIFLVGVPIEELLFAFAVGTAWSIAYEYMLGYKTVEKTRKRK